MKNKKFFLLIIIFLLAIFVGIIVLFISDNDKDFPDSPVDTSVLDLSGNLYKGQRLETLKISPNGKLLAVGAQGKVYIWNLTDKKEVTSLTISQELPPVAVRDISWKPDNKVLAIALKGGKIEIWNTEDWTRSQVIESPYLPDESARIVDDSNRLAYTLDQNLVATYIDTDRNLFLWLPQKQTIIKSLGKSKGSSTFSLDGSLVAAVNLTANSKNIIKVWRTSDGSEVWNKAFNDEQYTYNFCSEWGDCKRLALAPNNQSIAIAATLKGTIQVWGIYEDKLRFSIEAYKFEIGNIYFSRDGETLASISELLTEDRIPGDDYIKLWNMKDGMIIKKLQHGWTKDVNFSPDKNTLVSIEHDAIKFWNYK